MNNNPISRVLAVIASFFAAILGRFKWNSPPWVNFLRDKAQRRPVTFWGSAITIAALLIAGCYTWHWYKNLPQPQLITAHITAPAITPVADTLEPDYLTFDFGLPDPNDGENFTAQSVAPLNALDKEVTSGIEISPAIPGKWNWENDSRIYFTPDTDWPAEQKYTVTFSKDAFAAGAKMQSYSYSFTTQPFQAKISEFKFYQDPLDPKIHQAIATVEFNFPVDPKSFTENVALTLQSLKNGKQDSNAHHFNVTIKYDANKRVAYIQSEPLALTDEPRYLILTLDKGIKSSTDSAQTSASVSNNLLIPDRFNYLKVSSAAASIVRNEQDRPEQVLTVETTLGVTESQLNKALHVYLLPQNFPATKIEKEKENYEWQNPGEVTPSILGASTSLPLQAIPADRNYATLHSYKFNAKTPRFIYLKIDKGTQGFGDFVLSNDYVAVIKVPDYPKEIGFLHKGALLSLSSEKKFSVLVRGLPAVKFQIARVLPDNLNQLVTQTQGDFNNPYFINQSFNQQNISEIYAEIQQFNDSDPGTQQYTALDLEKYLSTQVNTGGPQGLFLLQATGWDVTNNTALDVKASRLLLLTDLGMLVKDNSDGSHDVFVQSIMQGAPVVNIPVSILGKNGLPILTRNTDDQGRVSFPILKDFVDDREPTVYIAGSGSDISFIPYNNPNRLLNYSRYDVGGIYTNNQDQQNVSAFLFSDRGLYRPGDTVQIGMIVKQSYAQPQPAGLPLEATITDPRGIKVYDQKITLDATGYLNIDFTTSASSPTGQYQVNLYTVKDDLAQNVLGSTTIRVAEFQPDRMRITAALSQKNEHGGWVSPENLDATVGLWNLYGAPAANRKISARIVLAPQTLEFDDYADYLFADPLVDPKKQPKVFSDTLKDAQTDDKGMAEFDLNLARFDKATYKLTFFAEGFEAEGGRSVAAQSTALVSPLSYLIGYKADGDLAYIKQNNVRKVNFIAINPQLEQLAVNDLKIQLTSLQPVTTLIKKPDGTYQYQSIIQTKVLSTKPFAISKEGIDYELPASEIGDYALTVLDNQNTELSHVKFSIIGASQQPLAKNAELSVKLNKTEFNAGDDIELQITAPYTGAGLITIERDKVYAVQWFKTDMTSSVQTIHIPADFQGNGYVNVAFVRNWDSPEIFVSPLSYNVTPFTINTANHDIAIDLDVEKVARPGEALTINYKSDKPGKIIVYGVDEGILQVANYDTPDPLSFFFQKRALEVQTQQTLDQILPKYIRDRELSSIGGDDGEELLANHLNPFKRKTDLPVVYWSGIVDTDTTMRQLTYQVPDYFNGTLRIIAVAVSDDSVGSAETETQIRGNFIINPNVPTFVAPGDEFEITASIANNVKGSGDNATVDVQLTSTPELEIIDSKNQALVISEGHEQTVRYKVRVKPLLGSAKLSFVASLGDKSSLMAATLSVRPAATYMTSLTSGNTSDANEVLPLDRSLYPEYRNVTAAVSSSPLILVAGLQRYLDNYPYGCTEQLTSKVLPLLAMGKQPWFSNDSVTITDKIGATIQMLGQRQMSSGAFSYWPNAGDNSSNVFATIYAMHFLTEAREQNYSVPNDMLSAGISYLKDFAAQNAKDMDQARNQAYAIYVLTRNEIVTTNYLTNLQLYLNQNQATSWQQDITGAYIAATYQLLKSQAEAERLIGQYKIQTQQLAYSDFYDSNIANAQYLYLVAKHFPDRLPALGSKLVMSLVNAMNSDDINTVLSGYTSIALSAYAQTGQSDVPAELALSETLANKQQKTLSVEEGMFKQVAVDNGASQITISNPQKQNYFYQLTQSGFDNKLSTTVLKQGMEIYREYRDAKGNSLSSTTLGNEIEVHIQVRALDNRYLSNVAIVDLLPGGFEVVADSVKNDSLDYIDVREDRVVFFTSLDDSVKQITYRIKAINTGKFTVPAIFAESMYDANIKAHGAAATFEITTP